MFRKRSEGFARVLGSRHVGFEPLESRRLMCATVTPTTVGTQSESILPAETVRAAILGPSAVEGRWKGDVTESGTVVEVKIVVTSTKAELIIGSDELTASLSSAHVVQIRKGTFDVKFTAGSASVDVIGTVTDSGLRISGSYSVTTGVSGTFIVKKYADS